MKKITVKILFVIIIVIIFAGGGTIYYFKQLNHKEEIKISKYGVSFSYPKDLLIQEIPSSDSSDGWYTTYQITNPNVEGYKRSTISVLIPGKNSYIKYKLADDPSKIIKTTLGKHQGEMTTYRVDAETAEDYPTHETRTVEEFESQFPNSPLTLEYIKSDADPASLDKTWEMIHKTLAY